MKQTTTLILVSLLLFSTGIYAQEKPTQWTLRACLDYALEHNIQVKKSKTSYLSGQEDTELSKAALFPSLSASVTQGYMNYPSGESVDNNSYSGNYSVNAAWKLYDGNRRNNTIKQQKIQNKADELAIEESSQDIQMSIIRTYMQVLYAMEAVSINQNTVDVSKAQCERAAELLKAGSISPVDFSQLESQHSTDKYQLVVAQTSLDNYKLQLKQLLELDINENIALSVPKINTEDVLLPLPGKLSIYNTALAVMPEIKSSLLRLDIAGLETKKAQSGYLPSLSLNAGVSSGHISGTDYSFGSQMRKQFNENVGLTLSIPISSNRENKTALNKARLAVQTGELELLDAQKSLLQSIEGIYLDATSSQTQYVAASERLKYVEESYGQIEAQFFLGMKNTLELLTGKNNLLSAQQEVLQSKYMAVMSIQLLNVYQKKPIDVMY